MKWSAGILVVVLYLVWPYYALIDLADAIKSSDAATINQYVDWDSIRTSFKAQLQSHVEKMPKSASEQKNPQMAVFANAVALTMANSFIDKVLTPEGLTRVLQISRAQAETKIGTAHNESNPQTDSKSSLFERIGFAFFVSPIHFRLDLRSANASQSARRSQAISVILTFKGTGWQITDLRLPEGGLSPKIAQATAN